MPTEAASARESALVPKAAVIVVETKSYLFQAFLTHPVVLNSHRAVGLPNSALLVVAGKLPLLRRTHTLNHDSVTAKLNPRHWLLFVTSPGVVSLPIPGYLS